MLVTLYFKRFQRNLLKCFVQVGFSVQLFLKVHVAIFSRTESMSYEHPWFWLHAMNIWRAAQGAEEEWIASLNPEVHTHRTHWLLCIIYNFILSSNPVTRCLQTSLPKWPSLFLPTAIKLRELSFLLFLFIFFCTVILSSFKYLLKTPFSWIAYWCSLIFYGYSESCHIIALNTTTKSNCKAEECPFIKTRPELQFSVHEDTGWGAGLHRKTLNKNDASHMYVFISIHHSTT